MKISVFGLGYVGSVVCACLAESGYDIVGVDVDQVKVDALNRGDSPVVEPALGPLIRHAVMSGAIRATRDALEAVQSSDLSLICVGTPSSQSGTVDLRSLERVCADIGQALRTIGRFHAIVLRSTVLPGTTRSIVLPILEQDSGKQAGQDFGVGYNPEFMREGTAIADFFAPPLTVMSAMDSVTLQMMKSLYEKVDAPQIELPLESAELLKSVCNSFHAMKVAFANEIGALCDALQVDGVRLMEAFCRDAKLNLSAKYLRPGSAFGGSCLPKDLRALSRLAEASGIHIPLLRGVLESNEAHLRRATDRIIATGKTRIGMLGLTFKPGTDDTRESPALSITQALLRKGCDVWAYEPDLDTEKLHGANYAHIAALFPNFVSKLVDSPRELARCADLLVITKPDIRYAQLPAELTPDHVVVDLVRFLTENTLPCPLLTLC
jgi:GDP-mannose 6-dehydrogenase